MKLAKIIFITIPLLILILPYALTIGWFTDKPEFLRRLLEKQLTDINRK